MRLPRGLPSRLAALALLLCLIAVIVTRLVLPIAEAFEASRQELDERRAQVNKLRASLADLQSVEAAGGPIDSTGQMWTGASQSLIAAGVQEAIQAMAANAGLGLNSVTYVEARAEDGVPTVDLRLEVTGDFEAFITFVHAVERNRPFLFVAAATITPRPSFTARAEEDRVVEARLDIAAPFSLSGGSDP